MSSLAKLLANILTSRAAGILDRLASPATASPIAAPHPAAQSTAMDESIGCFVPRTRMRRKPKKG